MIQQPSVIFIDEIELLSPSQDENSEQSRRIKTEFLVQMQCIVNENIHVIAATSTPWTLDAAIRRRFPQRIYVPFPDESERQALLKHHIKNIDHCLVEEDFIKLAKETEG